MISRFRRTDLGLLYWRIERWRSYQIDPQEQLMAALIDDEFNPIHLLFDDSNSVRVLASSSPEGRAGDLHWHLFFVDLEARRLIESAEFDSPWRWGSRSLDGKLPDRLTRIEIDGEDHLVILDSMDSRSWPILVTCSLLGGYADHGRWAHRCHPGSD